jgi:hypothetical protein
MITAEFWIDFTPKTPQKITGSDLLFLVAFDFLLTFGYDLGGNV